MTLSAFPNKLTEHFATLEPQNYQSMNEVHVVPKSRRSRDFEAMIPCIYMCITRQHDVYHIFSSKLGTKDDKNRISMLHLIFR